MSNLGSAVVERPVLRDSVAPAPVLRSDPRYVEYGKQLLAAARGHGDHEIDAADYAAWRAQAGDLSDKGAMTQIRLYREHRGMKVLDLS